MDDKIKTAKKEDIYAKFFGDCPYCGIETEHDYVDLVDGDAECSNCDKEFNLIGQCKCLPNFVEPLPIMTTVAAFDDPFQFELRTCPFCNGKPFMTHIGSESTRLRRVAIQCSDCGVRVINSADTPNFKWLENVTVEQWNERA